MRLAGLLCTLVLVLSPALAAAEDVLVVVAADNGIYEDPVRNEAERLVSESGATVKPFGDAVVESGVNPSEILRCVDKAPQCMKVAVSAVAVARVLVYQLKSDTVESGPRVVMAGWSFDGASGEKLKNAQRFCEQCTKLEVLVRLANELTGEIIAGGKTEASDTAIEVYTTPAGATVSIDGVDVGASGQIFKVAPGSHRVEVRLDGHGTLSLNVDAVANQTHTERLTLVPVGKTAENGASSPVYKWAFLGAGVVATALGVTWIAVDGPQSETGPNGIEVRKPEERNTLVPGVISTTVGVGLLGFAGYLFYKDMSAEEGTRAAVAPTRGGAILGLSGRF